MSSTEDTSTIDSQSTNAPGPSQEVTPASLEGTNPSSLLNTIAPASSEEVTAESSTKDIVTSGLLSVSTPGPVSSGEGTSTICYVYLV